LSNDFLNLTLSYLLKEVARLTEGEDLNFEGLPTRATLRWVGGGGSHDVTVAVMSLVGPKGSWYRGSAYTVTGHAIVAESLRHIYGLKTTNSLLRHHVQSCVVKIHFLEGELTVDRHTATVMPLAENPDDE
jgi:hypothetical protein